MKGLHGIAPAQTVIPGNATIWAAVRLEVWGVRDYAQRDGDDSTECEQVDPLLDSVDPDFWSIYEHDPEDCCTVVDDFPSRELAIREALRIGAARGLLVYDLTREGYNP